jgi:hypothetical protein
MRNCNFSAAAAEYCKVVSDVNLENFKNILFQVIFLNNPVFSVFVVVSDILIYAISSHATAVLTAEINAVFDDVIMSE